MAEEPRRRLPSFWPAAQVLLIALPLLVGARLGAEVDGPMDAAVAADLILDLLRPWSCGLAVVLGAWPEAFLGRGSARDPARLVAQTSWRMLAMLLVAPCALAIVDPPDLLSLSPSWPRLGTWLGAAAVPLWAAALLVRVRGHGRLLGLGAGLLWLALLVPGATVLGRALFLESNARLTPIAAAGVVGSVALYLAATERVSASLPRLMTSAAVLAGLTAALVGLRLSSAPLELAWTQQILDVSVLGRRALLEVAEPNLDTRLIEVDLDSGRVDPLPRRVGRGGYAGAYRFELWNEWLPLLLGGPRTVRPCRRDPSGGLRCAELRLQPGTSPLNLHPRLPLLVIGDAHTLLAWDLEADRTWVLRREGRIRWPCLTDGGDLIYRIQSESGPYLQEMLRLDPATSGPSFAPPDRSADVVTLPTDHGESCASDAAGVVAADFQRGRMAVGRISRLVGPGLPEGGEELQGEVGAFVWSRDGTTGAVALGRPRSVRFYRADLGLTAPIPVPDILGPLLSADGRWLLHGIDTREQPVLVVRSVPDGEQRLEVRTESARSFWDGRGRALRIEDGRLRALSPVTGEETVLFP